MTLLLLIVSCKNEIKKNKSFYCTKLSLDCEKKGEIITFITSKGKFDVKLDFDSNPITSANFLKNIKKEIYNKKKFYKIINYPNTKIVHGGVYPGINFEKFGKKNFTNIQNTIPLEIKFKNIKSPIYSSPINDPIELINLQNKFQKGSLAMVKIGENNSSSTEYFFSSNKISELDGRYSVFGKIINGYEVLDLIKKGDVLKKVEIMN